MPPSLRPESIAWRSQKRPVRELISLISRMSNSAETLVKQHISHISQISDGYTQSCGDALAADYAGTRSRLLVAARLHATTWGDRINVVTHTQISITQALEAANARLNTVEMEPSGSHKNILGQK